MTVNLVTFVICCFCCLVVGMLIGTDREEHRKMDAMEDLKRFYHENTQSLVNYIREMKGKEGDE